MKKKRSIDINAVKKLDIEAETKNLLLEVEEDIKEENFIKKWKVMLPILLAFFVIIIAGISFYKYQQYKVELQSKKDSLVYENALKQIDSDKDKKALETLKKIENTKSGYNVVSNLLQGNIMTTQKDYSKSFKKYLSIYNNKNYPKEYRTLSLISAGYISYNNEDFKKIKKEIKQIANNENESFKYSAQEIMALSLQKKSPKEAIAYLEIISKDPHAPYNLSSRVKILLKEIKAKIKK